MYAQASLGLRSAHIQWYLYLWSPPDNSHFYDPRPARFNGMLTSDIVSFEQLGPDFHMIRYTLFSDARY